jgi:prophage regulatory protein
MPETDRLLSIRDVVRETSLSRATVYRLVERGELARPRQLSRRRVAWRQSDVEAFKASRPVAEPPHRRPS